MGQAKNRGSKEQRVAEAMELEAIVRAKIADHNARMLAKQEAHRQECIKLLGSMGFASVKKPDSAVGMVGAPPTVKVSGS